MSRSAPQAFNPSYVLLRDDIVSRIPYGARRILDVGAADGTLGAHLLEARPDREVHGVESDAAMAAVASQRLSSARHADAEELDWDAVGGPGPFDCIVFADVLEHMREPGDVLARAVGRLAEDGIVVLSVPNIRHASAIWSIVVRGTFPRRARGLFDETHLRWFTTRDIVAMCSGVGLAVSEIELNLRLFDAPGGKVNDWVGRQRWLGGVPLLRQFLGYQIVVSAVRP
jgi:2-polyprenyl-3-methyl-5-hydroxy-6-metoxy-1,4-benzoquinol methylase